MRRRNRLPLLLPAILAAVGLIGLLVALASGAAVSPTTPAPRAKPSLGLVSFETRFKAGVHLLKVGAAAEAAQLFESARDLRPTQPEVHINLGFAYLAAGRVEKSETAFRHALNLHPGQINAYYGWAESLERLGDLEGARGAMRTFLHLVPADDPFRRRAMAALWEWQADTPATEPESADAPTSEDRFPSLSLAPLNQVAGRALTSVQGKVMVINVWATWCPPCRAELPSLQRLADSLDPKRFAVIGIAVDRDGDFVREYLRDVGVRFANYHDPEQAALRGLLDISALPQTFLVRPDGSIADTIVGERAWDQTAMRSRVEQLLAKEEAEPAVAKAAGE